MAKIIDQFTALTEKTIKLTGNIKGVRIYTDATHSSMADVRVSAFRKRKDKEDIAIIQPQVLGGVLAFNKMMDSQNTVVPGAVPNQLDIIFANGTMELNDDDYIELTFSGLNEAKKYLVHELFSAVRADQMLNYKSDFVEVGKFSKQVPLRDVHAIVIGKDVVSAIFTSAQGYTQEKRPVDLAADDQQNYFGLYESATADMNADDYYTQVTTQHSSVIINSTGEDSLPYVCLITKPYIL